MSAFAIEAETAMLRMQPGAHPVARLRRADDLRDARERHPSDPSERVLNDLSLEVQLSRIGDVGVDVAAASPVAGQRPPIRRRRDDLDGFGVGQALCRSLDAGSNALARDRAPDEDDLSMMPRQHAAAGRRLLDVERDDRARLDQLPTPNFQLPTSRYGDGYQLVNRPC